MKTISKKDFDKIITKDKENAVIIFYTTWCDACDKMEYVLYEVCEEYKKKVNFYKINADEEALITSQQGVMSVPTVIYYKSGEPDARTIGVCEKEKIKNKIDEIYLY